MSQTEPTPIEIRAVRDVQELRAAFAHIAPLFLASVDPDQDFRLGWLIEHLDADRELMLIAVDSVGQVRGAALGYRGQPEAVKLQAIAVDAELRRHGIGARLIRELEQRAQLAGCNAIYLGAEEPARPFYTALGYRGRRSVLSKSLSGGALATPVEARRERLAALKNARAQRISSGSAIGDDQSVVLT